MVTTKLTKPRKSYSYIARIIELIGGQNSQVKHITTSYRFQPVVECNKFVINISK